MALRINDTAPDFSAETTQGPINFHEWVGDGWALLFSHPKDFTPVCTTELGAVAGLTAEFAKRNCKVLGISVRRQRSPGVVEGYRGVAGARGHLPADRRSRTAIVKAYDMLPADAGDTSAGRTPMDNATARSVFVIGPDKKIKATLTYPMSTGRNFAEILRLVDSCQLTAGKQVATPANWEQGDKVIILPSVSDEAAKETYRTAGSSRCPTSALFRSPSSEPRTNVRGA